MTIRDNIIICLLICLGCVTLAVLGSAPLILALLTAGIICLSILVYGRAFRKKSDSTPLPSAVSLQEQARLADGIREAIIIINRQERVIYANPAAKRLFDLTQERPSLSELIEDTAIRQLAEDILAGRNTDPVTYHMSDPIERHIRVMGSAIYTSETSQQVKRAIIVFYDISDLVRVNRMRADFLANASHELKTPVASLLGYIETLGGHAKDDPAAQEKFLGIMKQQAERMQRLIDDLLSLRRIEIAEHLIPTETADLYLATRAATEAIHPLSENRKVAVKYQGPEEVLVIGIQDELVQLILNLLDNVVMITTAPDHVLVTCEVVTAMTQDAIWSIDPDMDGAMQREIVPLTHAQTAHAMLKVRDFGPGFENEHLPRIGERFYKISRVSTGHKRGTGLGLAIVKHIMRRHRGGLFIETKNGVGTEFTIALPLSPQHGGMLDQNADS